MASSTPPPYSYPSTKPHPIQNPLNHLQKQTRSSNRGHRSSQRIPSSPSPSSASSSPPSSSSSSACSSASAAGAMPSSSAKIAPCGSHGILPPRPELGPEFRGARSTRVVSKRNVSRPRYSNSVSNSRPPSASALDCLNQLSHVGSNEKSTRDLLQSFDLVLCGTDDYGFLIREIGEQGDHLKALQCFRFAMPRMRGSTERGKLLTSVISALGKMGRADLAKEVFEVGIADGYANTVYAYSALIAAYARNGMSAGAIALFESMKSARMKPNSVTYNTLIDACVKGGEDLHRTIEVFREMLRNGVRPDRITFNSLVAGCSRAGHWEDARSMFDEMIHLGIGRDVFTYNTFIDAVCKCGNMELAIEIMLEMHTHNVQPNVVTYSTVMDGYSKLERFEEALKLYEEVKVLGIPMDRVCFNTLLSIYVKMGRYEDVVRTSEEMERLGIDRDVVTYNALITGYGKQGRFEVISYLIQNMRAEGIVMNVLTYSTLIDVYSKGGMYQKAMEIYMEFRETGLKSDVVLYTTLIDTLCKNGRVESAVWLLNEMIRVGIRPNVVTYNSIINAFGRSALTTEDDVTKNETRHERGDKNHIVKAFGQLARARALPATEETQRNSQELFCILGLFQRMHFLGIRPNVVTFSSILNACSHCDSFEDASLLLEQLRSFDCRVYGVAHGLLMGSKEVWIQARLLFDELKRMDSSTAAAFYNALTDMLWHFGQRRGAQLVMMEGRWRNAWDTTWTDSCLDLHMMSPGAAQALVHAWLLNIRSVVYEGRELPNLVSILTGWGKHSKVSGSSALRHSIEVLLASLGAPFRIERFNMGRFISHGIDVAAWLSETCDVNALILYDVRVQTENGGFRQLPDFQALKL